MKRATSPETAADPVEIFIGNEQVPESGELLHVQGWGREQWGRLFSYARPCELDTGEVLIQQDDQDRALFFVTAGRLEVAVISKADDSIMPIRVIGAGSVVGELAFFDSKPRSAKVWSTEKSLLLQLTIGDYERYRQANMSEALDFLFATARLLAARIRSTPVRL